MDPPGIVLEPSRATAEPEIRRRRDATAGDDDDIQQTTIPIEPSPSHPPPPDEQILESSAEATTTSVEEDVPPPAPPQSPPPPLPAKKELFQPLESERNSPKSNNGLSPQSRGRRKLAAGSPPRSPPRSPRSSPRVSPAARRSPGRSAYHAQPLSVSPPSHRYSSSAGQLPTFKGQMMESPLDVQPLPMEGSSGLRSSSSSTPPPPQHRSVSSPYVATSGPLPTVKGQFMESPLDVQALSPPPPQRRSASAGVRRSTGSVPHSAAAAGMRRSTPGRAQHAALPRFKDQFREEEVRPMQVEAIGEESASAHSSSRSPESTTRRSAALRSHFVAAEQQQRPSVSALTTPDSCPAAFATRANNSSSSAITEMMDETVLPEGAALELIQEGFPLGLTKEMGRMRKVYPLRFWVVDNSGSMLETDCTRLVRGGAGAYANSYTPVQCSRWDELCQSVETHAHFAGVLESHATFRLLNDPGTRVGPQEITVDYIGDAPAVSEVLRKVEPGGSTPLTSHLQEIHERIAAFAESLRSNDQRAVVILATDGIPSNAYGESPPEVLQDFTDALRSLQELPVWVVIRLCTNEPDVLNYYRSLDASLEFSFEVIDDYLNEAKEIYRHNKWLNYGRPLHLCREMGYHRRVLDLLDERPLALSELRPFFKILFGRTDFPDPETDWNAFVNHISTMNEKQQWCPMTKKMADWVDVRKLNSVYSGGLLKSIQRSFGSIAPKG